MERELHTQDEAVCHGPSAAPIRVYAVTDPFGAQHAVTYFMRSGRSHLNASALPIPARCGQMARYKSTSSQERQRCSMIILHSWVQRQRAAASLLAATTLGAKQRSCGAQHRPCSGERLYVVTHLGTGAACYCARMVVVPPLLAFPAMTSHEAMCSVCSAAFAGHPALEARLISRHDLARGFPTTHTSLAQHGLPQPPLGCLPLPAVSLPIPKST